MPATHQVTSSSTNPTANLSLRANSGGRWCPFEDDMGKFKTAFLPVPTDWRNFKHHPYACIIEFGAGIDLDAMASQMRQFGYDEAEAIILWRSGPKEELAILSGRHRHKAAIMAEVTPSFKVLEADDATAQAFALKDVHRRHLTESQRAMIAARLTKGGWGGDRKSDQAAMLPLDRTQAQAAESLGVSERLVRAATKVTSQGSESLVKAVTDGTVTASDAARVADLPKPQQNAAVSDVLAGRAKTAQGAVKKQTGGFKNGEAVVSMKEVGNAIGVLTRTIDTLWRQMGAVKKNRPGMADSVVESPELKGIHRLIEEVRVGVEKVVKKYKKEKPK